MATRAIKPPEQDPRIPAGKTLIEYEDAVRQLSPEELSRATVAAMNTLLIQKGFYSAEEFRFQFRQNAQKRLKRR